MLDANIFKDRINRLYQTSNEIKNKKQNLSENNQINLLKLKNSHVGKRCFIIGGSPSLKQLDLSLLKDEITFTTNHGYKLKEFGLNNSTYHVMPDINTFLEDNVIAELPFNFSKYFLIYAGVKFPCRENVIFFDYTFASDIEFQFDITKPLVTKANAITLCMQIAFYTGVSEIYLLGVDLDFDKLKGHAYIECPGETRRQQTDTQKTAKLTMKTIDRYSQILGNNNVKIYNASPAGIVNCIPRVKYEDLF